VRGPPALLSINGPEGNAALRAFTFSECVYDGLTAVATKGALAALQECATGATIFRLVKRIYNLSFPFLTSLGVACSLPNSPGTQLLGASRERDSWMN